MHLRVRACRVRQTLVVEKGFSFLEQVAVKSRGGHVPAEENEVNQKMVSVLRLE